MTAFAIIPDTTDAYEAGLYCRRLLSEAERSLDDAETLTRVARVRAISATVARQNEHAADAAVARAWKSAIGAYHLFVRNRDKLGFLDGLREIRNDAARVIQDAPQPS